MNDSKQRIDVGAHKQAAKGRWSEILSRVGGVPLDLLDGNHHACPKCGGTDRFRMVDETAGAVYCNQCFKTRNGDGIAAIQWAAGVDFKEAAKRIAKHLGIDVATHRPNGKAGNKKTGPAKDLRFREWSSGLIALYLAKKPGITEAALLAAGAKIADYKGLTVLAFPIIGQSLNNERPTGWAVVNCISESVPTWDRDGNTTGQKKIKVLYGSKAGLFNVHATDRLSAEGLPELIWKVEGLTDMLALLSIIPEEKRDTHLVVSNSNGASENPRWQASLLSSHNTNVIHDADEPGQDGAATWAWAIAARQDDGLETRVVQLPYAVTATKGKDLRDWLAEGNSYEDFLALAKAAEPVEAEAIDYGGDDGDDFKMKGASKADPSKEAEIILGEHEKDDVATLRFWRGSWWRWSKGCYRELANEEVRALVINFMADRWLMVKARHATDVLEHMQAKSIMRSTTEPPAWLAPYSGFEEFDPNECLAMQNEVVHLPSLIDNAKFFRRRPALHSSRPTHVNST